jgi:antirepressor protein
VTHAIDSPIERTEVQGSVTHTVTLDGAPWVVLRPSVESMGIDYSTQLRKLKAKPWAELSSVTLQTGGQRRAVVVVRPDTWAALLAGLNERLGRPDGRHHLYVLAFSSRLIKVGQTGKLRTRLRQHDGEARNHGHSMTRCWVSGAHAAWLENEAALVEFCRARLGPPIRGNEYFASDDFDAVVGYAETLVPSMKIDGDGPWATTA